MKPIAIVFFLLASISPIGAKPSSESEVFNNQNCAWECLDLSYYPPIANSKFDPKCNPWPECEIPAIG